MGIEVKRLLNQIPEPEKKKQKNRKIYTGRMRNAAEYRFGIDRKF
jgi:hypothetical protein